jgi:signal transduction histidine kinase
VLREQLGRLTGLMNDLLDYGTPTRLELARGRLEGVVAQAVAACAPLGERAGVSVDAHVPPDLPALRMDARRLVTALRNLLENALQHAPRGGRVRLEARLDPGRGASWVECSIEDDGPGFAPEDLPQAFEPFFSRRDGGTGLGLSIAQRIVADHGGEVAARNRSPHGARVTVRLPTAPAGEG